MLNKKIGLKTALFIGLVAGLSSSFVSAASFRVNLGGMVIQALSQEAIAKNMSSVHFVDHENDFGGFIYWSSIDNLDNIVNDENMEGNPNCVGNTCGERVWLDNNSVGYICTQQVKGFYYDSQRGERLFPIDSGTALQFSHLQPGLTTEGGIYTNCISQQLGNALEHCLDEGVEDEAQCEAEARAEHGSYGYYGMVSHEYNLKNFGLIVGTKYQVNGETGWVSVNESLADTLIRYNNQYPVGFVYDYHGGVGFLGCRFNGSNKTSALHKLIRLLNQGMGLQDLFSINTEKDILEYSGPNPESILLDCSDISQVDLIQLVIEGLVGMGSESNLNIIGNQTNPKMQFFKSDYVDNTDLINYAKKKGESLCRGKWIKGEGAYDSRYNIFKEHVHEVASRSNVSFDETKLLYDWYDKISFEFGPAANKIWWQNQHQYWENNWENEAHLYCIDLTDEREGEETIYAEPGYTYVVKGGDVVVVPMGDTFDDNYNYDVYILDGGNLLLDKAYIQNKRIFTKDGFIAEDSYGTDDVSKKYQNDIENYRLGAYEGNYAALGAFIKGNFVINGHLKHICDASDWDCRRSSIDDGQIDNRYFVYGKITTKDSLEDLKNLFSWRCTNGISSDPDEKYCPQNNNYENAFMVVIDQDYDSPLF